MNVLFAHCNSDDLAYFPIALPDDDLVLVSGEPEGETNVEVLSVMHGKPVSTDAIRSMPGLRLIVTRSTGFDHIDLEAAKSLGISVCNVPEYGSITVAEFTFGLMLSLSRRIPQAVANSREGKFSVEGLMGVDLAGKTLGIVGLGKIGRHLAKMSEGASMRVVAHDPYKPNSIPLDDLLAQSDVVALCCPLTPQTHHLINTQALSKMKSSAFLVNTSRGGVIDAKALLHALDKDQIAGAALDVLEDELAPGEISLKLMGHSRALVTPHLAYDSKEALDRIRATTVEVIQAFKSGKVLNSVMKDE